MSNNPNALTLGKQRKRRIVLDRLYDRLPVNEETRDVSTEDFAGDGVHPQAAKDYIHEMVDIGILTRRMEYGTPSNGLTAGRHFHYTLRMSLDEARKALAALDEKNLIDETVNRAGAAKKSAITKKKARTTIQPAPVSDGLAIAQRGEEPIEAIVGPNPVSPFAALAPLRKNEAWALVEATRQYRSRTSKVSERIDGLLAQARELGVTVNEAALRDSIVFDRDERLESISLVIPYIDEIEAQVGRMVAQIDEMKRKLREANEAVVSVPKLKEQNERLLARLASKAN